MKTYARIDNGKVQEIFTTELDIHTVFPVDWTWVDISGIEEAPTVGWNFVDEVFSEGSLYTNKTLTNAELEESRLVAYAHPITGSDRYFAEALSLQAEGFSLTSQEVRDSISRGVSRKSEIRGLYPYTEN